MQSRILISSAVLAGILAFPSPSSAFRSGPPAGRNGSIASGGITCTQCHFLSGAPGSGSVQILNAPDNYVADAEYDIIIRISDSSQGGAGFQFSAETQSGTQAGQLIVIDSTNTQLNANPNWINHTQTGVGNAVANWAAMGNAAEYMIRWKAPSGDVGPVTFFAAGNAINNNFSSSFDHIYVASKTASFIQIPAVSQWGLVAMVLLMLSAASIVLLRRRIGLEMQV